MHKLHSVSGRGNIKFFGNETLEMLSWKSVRYSKYVSDVLLVTLFLTVQLLYPFLVIRCTEHLKSDPLTYSTQKEQDPDDFS